MKNNTYLKQAVLSLPMLIILLVFINPFDFFITVKVWMALLTVFILFFLIFSILLWTVKPEDEREDQHISISSRLAFTIGTIVLTAGIVYQSFKGNFDPWLPAVLIFMILTKIISLLYLRKRF